jgi:hypothetical protein
LASVEKNVAEISPSTLYAIACVMEGVPFINGSPQNTFVPGVYINVLSHSFICCLVLVSSYFHVCRAYRSCYQEQLPDWRR